MLKGERRCFEASSTSWARVRRARAAASHTSRPALNSLYTKTRERSELNNLPDLVRAHLRSQNTVLNTDLIKDNLEMRDISFKHCLKHIFCIMTCLFSMGIEVFGHNNSMSYSMCF